MYSVIADKNLWGADAWQRRPFQHGNRWLGHWKTARGSPFTLVISVIL